MRVAQSFYKKDEKKMLDTSHEIDCRLMNRPRL